MNVPRNVAKVAMGLVVAVVAAYTLYYRATLHDWPWQGDPARLSICGRDYAVDGAPRTPSQLRANGTDVRRLYPVFRAPPIIGPQVYSDMPPAKRAALNRQPGQGCGGSLIIKDAPDQFRVYAFQGGP
jgi:hypothetical protein